MNKVDQMWYLLLICHDFATVVIPFFRAVLVIRQNACRQLATSSENIMSYQCSVFGRIGDQ